jgi:hypothetical protein
VILLLWLPVLARYAIPGTPVSDATVEAARNAPSDALLREVRDFYLLSLEGRGREIEIAVAEKILQGKLELPGRAAASISIPFSPDDLDGLPSSLQLLFAGYVVPDFLLAAYVATDREEFFAMGRDTILAWGRYEQSTWLNRGYLWTMQLPRGCECWGSSGGSTASGPTSGPPSGAPCWSRPPVTARSYPIPATSRSRRTMG